MTHLRRLLCVPALLCAAGLGSRCSLAQIAQASTAEATVAQAKSATRSAAELSDDDLVAAVANSLGPDGIVPSYRGYNASLISSSQHDSISGWSNLLTPSIAFRFNRVFSADVSTPIFLYIHNPKHCRCNSNTGRHAQGLHLCRTEPARHCG